MSAGTLARRLERLETKLHPTDKPGITVIVDGAGEPKIFHSPDPKNTRQDIRKKTMIKTLTRRLEQLETFVLPTDPPQVYIRVHSVSPEGKLVRTVAVKVGYGRPANLRGRLRPAPIRYR